MITNFKKIPNGTILICRYDTGYKTIHAKINNKQIILLEDISPETIKQHQEYEKLLKKSKEKNSIKKYGLFIINYTPEYFLETGEVENINEQDYKYISIAPKWVQKLY